MDRIAKNMNYAQDSITLIKRYQVICKSKNKRVIKNAKNQGLSLKGIKKEEDRLLDAVG